MMGESLFSGFCWLWLVTGSMLLAARVAEGLRGLDHLKNLKVVEKQILEEIERQIGLFEQEADGIEAQCAETRSLLGIWEKRLTDLVRKPMLTLRLAGREVPLPSDRLWVASYPSADSDLSVFGAAWAEDETHAHAKLVAGLGPDLGSPRAVLPLSNFKRSLLS